MGVSKMKPAIIDIPGIGPATVETLREHRINSLVRLAGTSVGKIAAIPGFSEARAKQVITAATDLLAAAGISPSSKARGDKSGKNVKTGGKGKKDKKDKKKKDKKNKKDKKKDKGKGKGKGKDKKKGRK
jgi:ribosomal protein L12E/L44/L45/RPP1/RPP2